MKCKWILLMMIGVLLVGCTQKKIEPSDRETKEETTDIIEVEEEPEPEPEPELVEEQEGFNIFEYDGRYYVVGDTMKEKFEKNPHLPYTKTILGAGPNGETVVFEVDKKNPEFVDELIGIYEEFGFAKPYEVEAENGYYVYNYHGRVYVIGQEKTNQNFLGNPHLPYTKTILGGGPNGETVVFEVDKKNPELTIKLEHRYQGKPYSLVSKDGYHVYLHHGRIYVIGQEKTNASFQANPHLPYTKTILGAGPNGETVVFEVDKKDPALTQTLIEMYNLDN